MPSPEQAAPKIVFASANLLGAQLGLQSPEAISDYALEAGYDGVEYHAIHTRRFGADHLAAAANSGELALNSLHASFRTNHYSRDTNQFGGNDGLVARVIDSPAGALLMPETIASAHFIGRVQRRLADRVPVVLFPQRFGSIDNDMRQAAQDYSQPRRVPALFQPTDHVAELVGAKNLADFRDRMFKGRGYDGFILDTFHARRSYGERPNEGMVSRPTALYGILPKSRAVQLSLNRTDLQRGEEHINTEEELEQVLDGQIQGYLAEVLDGAKEVGQVEYVAVELAATGLRHAARQRGISVKTAYAQIAQQLRYYLEAN